MNGAQFVLFFRDKDVPLSGIASVGRDPTCDLVIDGDPKVSRVHARFVVRGDVVTVDDLASANGVFVNGARVLSPVRVVPGDVVRVGDERISLRKVGLASSTRGSTRPLPIACETPQPVVLHVPDPDLQTEPYGVDLYHVRWLQIEDAVSRCDWSHADDLLNAQLRRVRRDIEAKKPLSPITLEKACRYCIDMAIATLNGEWLNHVLRLYAQVERPLPRAGADVLPRLVRDVIGIDVEAFECYVAVLLRIKKALTEEERERCARVESALDIVRGPRGNEGAKE